MISIIIPVYNCQKYLSRCIDSILSQAISNYEIILVDDGSSDESGQICDNYAELNDNIKVIHIENGGVSIARNTGISFSKGEWLWFVDADDWIQENSLNVLNDILSQSNAQLLYWNIFVDRGAAISEESNIPKISVVDTNSFIITRNPSMVFQFLFNKEIINQNLLSFTPGVKCGEDVEFIVKYLSNVKSIITINGRLYHYFIHPTSVMRNNPNYLNMSKDILGVVKRCIEYWAGNGAIPSWADFVVNKRVVTAIIYLTQAQRTTSDINEWKEDAIRILKQARMTGIKYKPSLKIAVLFLKMTLLLLKLKIGR